MNLKKMPVLFKGKSLWIQDEEGELDLFVYKFNNIGMGSYHLDLDHNHKDTEIEVNETEID